MITNEWCVVGVVMNEPKLMKVKGGSGKISVVVKAILKLDCKEETFLPIVAYNKKAMVFPNLVHRGCKIYAKGIFKSRTELTSIQTKTLVSMVFKLNDFAVLQKEQLDVEITDYCDIAKLYEPDNYMEEYDNAK